MKKYLLLLVSFFFLFPFGVGAADLKKTFDVKTNIQLRSYVDVYALPSYDNSGKLDGNIIYYLDVPKRKISFSNMTSSSFMVKRQGYSSDIILVKYGLDNKFIYEKSYADSSFYVDCEDIYSDDFDYKVKGESDILVNVYGSSDNLIFTKQYGGSGYEYYRNSFYSYDNKGVHDGYIIMLYSTSSDLGIDPGYIMLKYDLKGNLVWQKNVNDYYYFEEVDNVVDGKLVDCYYYEDNYLAKYNNIDDVYVWDVDTGLYEIMDMSFSYTKNGKIDGILVVGASDQNTDYVLGTIIKYDLDGNEVFRKTYDDSIQSIFTGVRSSRYFDNTYDGYIVTAITEENETLVLKYDFSFNLLWKDVYTSDGSIFFRLVENYNTSGVFNGYLLYQTKPDALGRELSNNLSSSPIVKKLDLDNDYNMLRLVKYTYDVYDVLKDVTDEGTITVNSSAFAGEVVKVTVTPKEGYTLKRIVVMDEDGNEIEVTGDGTFVMPEGKVTVVALYNRISNPETVSACYVVLGIILLICIGTLIVNKKKEDFS